MAQIHRVLLAEDNLTDIELTLRALKEYRLANEVDVVRDGEEALDYLYRRGRFTDRPTGNPGLVLLDNKMPKFDGLEVLRRIRTDVNLKGIPVIMLTASHQHGDFLKSHALGVKAYLVKPVDFFEFVMAVRDLGASWGIVGEPSRGSTVHESRVMPVH